MNLRLLEKLCNEQELISKHGKVLNYKKTEYVSFISHKYLTVSRDNTYSVVKIVEIWVILVSKTQIDFYSITYPTELEPCEFKVIQAMADSRLFFKFS